MSSLFSSPSSNEHRFGLSITQSDQTLQEKHLLNVRETLLKIYRGLSYPQLCEKDTLAVQSANASTAFGELTPNGVTKMCDPDHLDAAGATVCYDLGMGLGRMIIQIFLQFPNLKKVVGVELCPSRAAVAFAALRELAKDDRFRYEENSDGTRLRIIEKSSEAKESKTPKKEEKKEDAKHPWTENLPSTTRYLEMRCCNLFTCKDATEDGHIVVLETAFPSTMYSKVADFLSQFKKGTRSMGYMSFEGFYSYTSDGTLNFQSRKDMPWTVLTTDSFCEASFGASFFFYRKN